MKKHLDYLANLGMVKANHAAHLMTILGQGDLMETKIGKLMPKQLKVLKLATNLASSQDLLLFDEPFHGLEQV